MTSGVKRDVSPLRIGVKYCGGCNPEYDRGEVVEKIRNRLSAKILWVGTEETADWVIAVQGCPTACADLSPFDESKVFQLKGQADLEQLIEKLAREISRRDHRV